MAARLVYPNGRPQWSGGSFPSLLWLFALASGLGRGARFRLRHLRSTPASGFAGGFVDWAPAAVLAIGREADARFAQIAARIGEWAPDALVVGIPFHPDGAAHENTRRAQRFSRQLQGRFGLPVFEVDERYSTTEALQAGARDADAAAACIILEQFLRTLS